MMKITGFQFLSKASIKLGDLGRIRESSKQRPDLSYDLCVEAVERPFPLTFAQLTPQAPSIGAFQYVDRDEDRYLSRRWPTGICITGSVDLPDDTKVAESSFRRDLMFFARKLLWELRPELDVKVYSRDQLSSSIGYRREYLCRQLFDFCGVRTPSPIDNFVPTAVGEPVGPGVITIDDVGRTENINELVWSQILTFPTRSSFETDSNEIRKRVIAQRLHYNSHNELNDAQVHLMRDELKPAIRLAAPAVEASIMYYAEMWGVSFPVEGTERRPFIEKIDCWLATAGRPKYSISDPKNAEYLQYLYLSRNAMHEADCYYRCSDMSVVNVRTRQQAAPLIEAAFAFIVWVDALV
jgi:hypothetical protein